MNLKIIIPSALFSAGGITASSYLVFANNSEPKEKEKIVQKEEIKHTVLEYVLRAQYSDEKITKICRIWKKNLEGSGSFIFDDKCEQLFKKFPEDLQQKNFKGLRVGNDLLKQALEKENLSKGKNEDIKENDSWETKEGLSCQIEKDSNQKILVKCLAKEDLKGLGLERRELI